MSYFESLEKAVNYIENHLTDEIDLSIIAKEAGYSLYHFHRIFKGIIGDSMKDYITKRRVTEAAKDLASSNQSIIDIAIKYGYSSREAFTRAFERVYGRNPSVVKRDGLLYFVRQPMTTDYMMFEYQKRKEGLQPLIRKLPKREIIGKKWTVKTDGSNLQDIPLLWHNWHKNKEWMKIKNIKHEDECMGICIHSNTDTFDYMIGHEVYSVKEIPDEMILHQLAPSYYAVFKTIGPITESVQKTWDYIYSIWLYDSSYQHAGLDDIEYYYNYQGELCADLYLPIKK